MLFGHIMPLKYAAVIGYVTPLYRSEEFTYCDEYLKNRCVSHT
jgi:hypothetical protein